jgi:hypothetical protein
MNTLTLCSPARGWGAGVLLVGLLALASNARSAETFSAGLPAKEYFKPTNVRGVAQLPRSIRRVVVLPLAGGLIVSPETAQALEEVFIAELQKQVRFEVVRLTRSDCQQRFGQSEYASVATLPADFLPALARAYAADAVLLIDLTAYRGYRPLQLGVRAKLVTITNPQWLWTFDEIFSADDPGVVKSVRYFYRAAAAVDSPVDLRSGALQSPTKFAAYVAAATFATLPPR